MRSTKIKKNFCSSSLWTCLHHMVILISQNKITDFLMILAWACPFNNVTTLGQKVTVYEGTVGLDVTRNKATGVKSHIIDIDKKMNIAVLSFTTIYCELHSNLLSSMDGNIFFLEYMYSHHILLFCYLHATLESLGSLQMTSSNGCLTRYFVSG